MVRACQRGMGVALLPDYLVEENGGLVELFGESETIALDAYFVYPEELKPSPVSRCFAIFWYRRPSAGISDAAWADMRTLVLFG